MRVTRAGFSTIELLIVMVLGGIGFLRLYVRGQAERATYPGS
jgi:prepilin-type N-terminal cleavage/methylation domain-containing protein